jgi:hypothetical protein
MLGEGGEAGDVASRLLAGGRGEADTALRVDDLHGGARHQLRDALDGVAEERFIDAARERGAEELIAHALDGHRRIVEGAGGILLDDQREPLGTLDGARDLGPQEVLEMQRQCRAQGEQEADAEEGDGIARARTRAAEEAVEDANRLGSLLGSKVADHG